MNDPACRCLPTPDLPGPSASGTTGRHRRLQKGEPAAAGGRAAVAPPATPPVTGRRLIPPAERTPDVKDRAAGRGKRAFPPALPGGLVIALFSASLAALEPATFIEPVRSDDPALFREGLRERGLKFLLEQFDAEADPGDAVLAALRRRHSLLEEAQGAFLTPAGQRDRLERAHRVLRDLIDAHPGHPARLYWLLEVTRDSLERLDGPAFEAVLLYELGGGHARRVAERAAQAQGFLSRLRHDIAGIWEATGRLEEPAIDQAAREGRLWMVEAAQSSAAMLGLWAELCEAIWGPFSVEERRQRLRAIPGRIGRLPGGAQEETGDPLRRAQALTITAIAYRHLRDPENARRAAQEAVTILNRLDSPPSGRTGASFGLLAVLEQLRAWRDSGDRSRALAALEQARQWATRRLPDDPQAALALALTERSILAGATTGSPALRDLLKPPEALRPVLELMNASPAAADRVYQALGAAAAELEVHDDPDPAGLRLVLGAAAADLAETGPEDPAAVQRLNRLVDQARQLLASARGVPPDLRGELVFLIGRARYLLGQPVDSASALLALAEQYPEHPRAATALEQAVAVMQEQLFDPSAAEASPQAWTLFARAAETYRRRFPHSPLSPGMAFPLGLAREQLGQWAEAAKFYMEVPGDHPAAAEAALRRAWCLYRLSRQPPDTRPASAEPAVPAADVEQAARQALEMVRAAETAPEGAGRDPCLPAQAAVLLATVLNDARPPKSQEAIALTADIPQRFPGCPAMAAAALQEQIRALGRLGRLEEVGDRLESFLNTHPDQTGPLLIGMIEELREGFQNARDRADTPELSRIAGEMIRLTDLLVRWAGRQPGKIPEKNLWTLRVWSAEALLEAGRSAEALERFSDLDSNPYPGAEMEQDHRPVIRLGLADSLRASGRTAEALPIYAEMYRRLPEGSPDWWWALAGSLTCHNLLGSDPREIVQAIRQRRHLSPDMGGPRWQPVFDALERTCRQRASTLPAADRP